MSEAAGDNKYTIWKYIIIVIGSIIGFCIMYYCLGDKITKIDVGSASIKMEHEKSDSTYIDINSTDQYYVNVNKAKLREFPSTDSVLIAELSINTIVYKLKRTYEREMQEITTTQGNIEDNDFWYFVKKESGDKGWIYGYFISDKKTILPDSSNDEQEESEDVTNESEESEDVANELEESEDVANELEESEDVANESNEPDERAFNGEYFISNGLDNRRIVSPTEFNYNIYENGHIVMKVCFNERGDFLKNERILRRRSNTDNRRLIEIAEDQSNRIKLTSSNRKRECGEITFRFRSEISDIEYEVAPQTSVYRN